MINCGSSELPNPLKHEHSVILKKMENVLDVTEEKVNQAQCLAISLIFSLPVGSVRSVM